MGELQPTVSMSWFLGEEGLLCVFFLRAPLPASVPLFPSLISLVRAAVWGLALHLPWVLVLA